MSEIVFAERARTFLGLLRELVGQSVFVDQDGRMDEDEEIRFNRIFRPFGVRVERGADGLLPFPREAVILGPIPGVECVVCGRTITTDEMLVPADDGPKHEECSLRKIQLSDGVTLNLTEGSYVEVKP
jgi:hypothetical protein